MSENCLSGPGPLEPATSPSEPLRMPAPDNLGAKLAVTIREAALLGLGSQRQLRQWVADGVLKKAVIRSGVGTKRRKVRLLLQVLIQELKGL